jgi:hypothetical protein
MQKNTHILSLSVLLIASIATLGVSWSSATPKLLSGIFGTAQPIGSFLANGNAGKIIVDVGNAYEVDVDPADGSGLVLTGRYMFLETAGWVELTKNTASLPGAPVGIRLSTIPSNTTITEWQLAAGEQLYGWSDNAGWIDFNPTNVSSGLIYRGGGLSSFTGQAWSDTLGWLDFSKAIVDFQNKIKIIGNKGSEKIFDEIYDVGSRVTSKNTLTNFFNEKVNPAIANMTRNISDSDVPINKGIVAPASAEKLNKDVIIYKIQSSETVNVRILLNDITKDIRTVIVVGGGLIIDSDILPNPDVKTSRAVIAKKDENGAGWNIYIDGAVKNIYATIVAEGSIFSASGPGWTYNDSDAKRDNLPKNQLYIYGSSLSRNTIGWSQVQVDGKVVCPNLVTLIRWCDKDEAAIYDWNYFRTYDKDRATHGSLNPNYENYSVIIEYDSRIIQDPPPWFSL